MYRYIQVIGKTLLALIFSTLFIMLINSIQKSIWPSIQQESEAIFNLLNSSKPLFAVLGTILFMNFFFERKQNIKLGFSEKKIQSKISRGMLFGVLLLCVHFSLMFLLGQVKIISMQFTHFISESFLISVIVVFMQTFSEELFFRGYIQGIARKALDLTQAVFISSIPFTIIHLLQLEEIGNPVILLNLFLLGIFLALVREKTGSIWCSIGIQFVWSLSPYIMNTSQAFIELKYSYVQWISGGQSGFIGGFLNTFLMISMIMFLRSQIYYEKEQKKFRLVG